MTIAPSSSSSSSSFLLLRPPMAYDASNSKAVLQALKSLREKTHVLDQQRAEKKERMERYGCQRVVGEAMGWKWGGDGEEMGERGEQCCADQRPIATFAVSDGVYGCFWAILGIFRCVSAQTADGA